MHGQAVSGRACAEVAVELGVPELLGEMAPTEVEGGIEVEALLASERALASVIEAVIGSCYLHHGFEVTASATVAAFSGEIEIASERLLDFKSALQERLARAGARVRYDVTGESGPSARPRLRRRRERQRRGRRRGLRPLEEGGRAGGRRAGAGGARLGAELASGPVASLPEAPRSNTCI